MTDEEFDNYFFYNLPDKVYQAVIKLCDHFLEKNNSLSHNQHIRAFQIFIDFLEEHELPYSMPKVLESSGKSNYEIDDAIVDFFRSTKNQIQSLPLREQLHLRKQCIKNSWKEKYKFEKTPTSNLYSNDKINKSLPYTSSINIFFSYSHKDEKLRDELANHLSNLKNQGIISTWYDRDITAGREWENEIDDHLNSAQIILLLISSDFLASHYCFDQELNRAIERHESEEAMVIPIILRPVDWQNSKFSKLKVLPKNGKPVTTWSNQDEAFLDIVEGIRQAINNL